MFTLSFPVTLTFDR